MNLKHGIWIVCGCLVLLIMPSSGYILEDSPNPESVEIDLQPVGPSGIEPVGDGNPQGEAYQLWEHHGGTWYDAEKSSDNAEDDLMCWAATTANVLQWTGWGNVNGLENEDEIFEYFQDHWTDAGGNIFYGVNWWFDGINDVQGESGWSQEDVDGGGGFYPSLEVSNYSHHTSDDASALSTVEDYITSGYGTALSIGGDIAHVITCWGFNYNPENPSEYYGVWVTDSDDSKYGDAPRPDSIHYYEVQTADEKWYLQDYAGSSNNFVSEVYGLEAVPEPQLICMVLILIGLRLVSQHVYACLRSNTPKLRS